MSAPKTYDLEFNDEINEYVLYSRKRKVNRISKDLCHASETMAMEETAGLSDGSSRIEKRKKGRRKKKGRKKTTNAVLNKYFDKPLQRGQWYPWVPRQLSA